MSSTPAQARAALVGVRTATAQGKGFFVAPGLVVTASLLVLDDAEVRVERLVGAAPVRVVYPETEVVAVDHANALALVRIRNLDVEVRALTLSRAPPSPASPVAAWAFASPKDAELRVVGPKRVPIAGAYARPERSRGDTEAIEVRGRIHARHLGGPVVDADARVVGIVGRVGRRAQVAPSTAIAALLARAEKTDAAPTVQEAQARIEALLAQVVHAGETQASAALEVHVAPVELRGFVARKAELLGRARRCLSVLSGAPDGAVPAGAHSFRQAQTRAACAQLLGAYAQQPEGRCVLASVRVGGRGTFASGAWKTCLRLGVPRVVQQLFRWLFDATPAAPALEVRVTAPLVAEGRANFWRAHVSWRAGGQTRSDTLLLQRDRGQIFVRTTGFGGRLQGALASRGEAVSTLLAELTGGAAAAEAPGSTAEASKVAVAVVSLAGGRYVPARGGAAVAVSRFGIDATEVTVDAYRACVAANACEAPSTRAWWPKKAVRVASAQAPLSPPSRSAPNNSCNGLREERGAHPVNCVAAREAEVYCTWRGGRLPSEDEWEWAARGREEARSYPWGATLPGAQLCWDGAGNDQGRGARKGTCAAGGHRAGDSRDGVADLAGNVWEWTATQFGRLRVYRGGSWADSGPRLVSVAGRSWSAPEAQLRNVGFRCAYAR